MTEALQLEIRTLRALLDSERDPGGRAFAPLADAYRRAGRIPEALRVLREGLAKHPEFVTGHVVAARLYVEQGLTAEGAIAARRALELDGENVSALRSLLRALDESGDREEAEKVRSQLTTLEPDFTPDWGTAAPAESGEKPTVVTEEPAALAPTIEIRSLESEPSPGLTFAASVEEAAGPASTDDPGPLGGGMIDLTALAPLPFADVTPSALAPDLPVADTPSDSALDIGFAELQLAAEDASGDSGTSAPTIEEPVMELASLAPDGTPEPAEYEPVLDLPTLEPESTEEPVFELASLAPESSEAEEEPVMELASLAPEATEDEPVMDLPLLAPEAAEDETVVDLAMLAPDAAEDEPVMDLATLAPDAPADEDETVMDLAMLAPDAEPDEPVVDLAMLAPDAAEDEPVVDLATLAPDAPAAEEETVVDLAMLAPDADDDEPVMDLAMLAPDAPGDADETVVDLASLAPDSADEEPVMDLATLAPDAADDETITDLAMLAPDESDDEPPMDLPLLAPDAEPEETAHDVASLAPSLESLPEPPAPAAPEGQPPFELEVLAPGGADTPTSATGVENAGGGVGNGRMSIDEAVEVGFVPPDETDEPVIDLDQLRSEHTAVSAGPPPTGPLEVEMASVAEADDHADDHADGHDEPIFTRTLAELYAGQGAVKEAITVLKHLLGESPGDEGLARRIAELESGGASRASRAEEPAVEDEEPEEDHEVEALARELADSGRRSKEVDSPFAWTDRDATDEAEGPSIREYFDGLLSWEPQDS